MLQLPTAAPASGTLLESEAQDAEVFTGLQRQAEAQDTHLKATRAHGTVGCQQHGRDTAALPMDPSPAPTRPPVPAGRAQVRPADDAVLLGRVQPLESRQRPLLDPKAALSHVPKNNSKKD